MATIATLHRIGGCGQQLVIQKGQGFFKGRGDDLFSGITDPLETLDPLTQLLQLSQGCLRAATPVKQRVDVLHDLTQFASPGQSTGEG